MAKARRKEPKIGGPFLEAAVICEQVIHEKDGTFSVIRMVNKLTLHETVIHKGVIVPLPLIGLISFKAGDFKGRKSLSLYVTDPSGNRTFMPMFANVHFVEFFGGDTGAIANYPLHLVYDKSGTYWFDVVVERTLCSRMPLTFIVESPSVSSENASEKKQS